MAREKTPEETTADNERKQLAEEKKKLKTVPTYLIKFFLFISSFSQLTAVSAGRRKRRQQPSYFWSNHTDRTAVDRRDLCHYQTGYRRVRRLGCDTDTERCPGIE